MPQTTTRYERLHNNSKNNTDARKAGAYYVKKNDGSEDSEEIELNGHKIPGFVRNEEFENYKNGQTVIGSFLTTNAKQNTRRASASNVAGDGVPVGMAHVPVNTNLMQMAIGTLFTILLYLTLSICLTFYQKALIKKLKFPLTIVSYHLVIKYLLSTIVRAIYRLRMGKARVLLDCKTVIRKMGPTGIASGIDIGFSNWGLELVPISLYTMTKSSTIVFILFFAILLGLEKKSWSLVLIVGLIATGLFMFTYKSTEFDALGFIFILVASLSSGVRWSFAQFIMQKSKLGLHNPIDMIYYMQPWMILSLLPFLIAFEGKDLIDVVLNLPQIDNEIICLTLLKISFAAIVAFFMEISEFLVLSQTSSLTLSIAGIFKDICQLALAVELNGDQLSLLNVFGLVVCLAGICCHVVHKYSTLTKLEELKTIDNDLHYNDTNDNISANGSGSGSGHNSQLSSVLRKHSSQTVPLLEHNDTDDSNNDEADEQNASDVIFDVLKRRDMR